MHSVFVPNLSHCNMQLPPSKHIWPSCSIESRPSRGSPQEVDSTSGLIKLSTSVYSVFSPKNKTVSPPPLLMHVSETSTRDSKRAKICAVKTKLLSMVRCFSIMVALSSTYVTPVRAPATPVLSRISTSMSSKLDCARDKNPNCCEDPTVRYSNEYVRKRKESKY